MHMRRLLPFAALLLALPFVISHDDWRESIAPHARSTSGEWLETPTVATEVRKEAPSDADDVVAGAKEAPRADALVEVMQGDTGVNGVLFVFFSLFVGLLVKTVWGDISLLAKWCPLPYTVVLFVIGLGWGYSTLKHAKGSDLDDALQHVLSIDPHLLLGIFIPPLLMESGLALNTHVFSKVIYQCLWLAGPGVLVCIGASMMVAKYLLPDGWGWNECALFGAIVSATDPVAVSALLKELGAPESLATVIEGESLFNDGTAFVLFMIFLKNAETTQSWDQVGSQLLKASLGGVGFGILMGALTVLLLKYNYRRSDARFEALLTLMVPYLTFWTAENPLKLSGVLAVVCMAVVVNRYGGFYIRYRHSLHQFWEILSWIANTLVFMISGALVGEMFAERHDFLRMEYQVVNYLCMNLIRAAVIFGSMPVLKQLGYGFDCKQAAVATWGGLRGAVGLAMGIIVLEDKHLDKEHRTEMFDYVAFLVLFTLVINGTTSGWLLQWLEYDCKSATRVKLANKARAAVMDEGRGWIQAQRAASAPGCGLTQWDVLSSDLHQLDVNTATSFADFRVKQADETQHNACEQVEEQLLLLFSAQLDSLSRRDVIDPAVLLTLKDSCDALLEDSAHNELDNQLMLWWSSELEFVADEMMHAWNCIPNINRYTQAVQLRGSLKAVEMCLGFMHTARVVAKNSQDAWDKPDKQDTAALPDSVQQLERKLVQQLDSSADAARAWLERQPKALVAMAETRMRLKELYGSLEEGVEELADAGTLGEAEGGVVLHAIRDQRVRSHYSYRHLARVYNDLESKLQKGGVKAPTDTLTDTLTDDSKPDHDPREPLLEEQP